MEKAITAANRLIVEHLELVPKIVRSLTFSYSRLPVQEYEELTQIGYLALCQAASGYDWERPFAPYARTAIRNAIYDYWRDCARQKNLFCSLDAIQADENGDASELPFPDKEEYSPESQILQKESAAYLSQLENRSRGMIQKGIASLRLQQSGYTSAELGRLYQVPPNRVRAWQSKAKKLLRQDQELYALLA